MQCTLCPTLLRAFHFDAQSITLLVLQSLCLVLFLLTGMPSATSLSPKLLPSDASDFATSLSFDFTKLALQHSCIPPTAHTLHCTNSLGHYTLQ